MSKTTAVPVAAQDVHPVVNPNEEVVSLVKKGPSGIEYTLELGIHTETNEVVFSIITPLPQTAEDCAFVDHALDEYQ